MLMLMLKVALLLWRYCGDDDDDNADLGVNVYCTANVNLRVIC